MVTIATEAICSHVTQSFYHEPESVYIEANLSGDKKATANAMTSVRGKRVVAEVRIDAQVSMELLVSIFLPSSPLHDGAAVIQDGRVSSVGCILPLTLRNDLPEGVGTRHRAAVGITEETDAVVIVVSEETATISVVMAGEMVHGLDAPRLRVVLRDVLSGERRELPASGEISKPLEVAEAGENASSAS